MMEHLHRMGPVVERVDNRDVGVVLRARAKNPPDDERRKQHENEHRQAPAKRTHGHTRQQGGSDPSIWLPSKQQLRRTARPAIASRLLTRAVTAQT